ncbi:hypothetical protein BDQ17DRAFT_1413168 [Cyathus striatus]|nr:hypothetical protein BDQ17DRAFT_1413168 [Cyathus striatus]
MFILAFLSLSLLLLISALRPQAHQLQLSLQIPTCLQPPHSDNRSEWSTPDYIESHVPDPLLKPSVFWSGNISAGISVLSYAERCATHVGGHTCDMMLCEQGGFVMPRQSSVHAEALRDFASRVFARRTVGRAYVVYGNLVNPHGTWATIELPALTTRENVSAVIELDRGTCKERCYVYCRHPCWIVRVLRNVFDCDRM